LTSSASTRLAAAISIASSSPFQPRRRAMRAARRLSLGSAEPAVDPGQPERGRGDRVVGGERIDVGLGDPRHALLGRRGRRGGAEASQPREHDQRNPKERAKAKESGRRCHLALAVARSVGARCGDAESPDVERARPVAR